MPRQRTKLDLLRDVEKLINKAEEPVDIAQIADMLKTNWVSVKDCCEYLFEKGLVKGIDIKAKRYAPKSYSPSASANAESLISVKRESDDSPNSPHDSSAIKEEANFS